MNYLSGSLVLVQPQTWQGPRITHIVEQQVLVAAVQVTCKDIAKRGDEGREPFHKAVVTDVMKANSAKQPASSQTRASTI